jgi:hypothetical protein
VKTLPINDCRLPIEGSFDGCRFARGRHNGGQGVGFFKQSRQFFCGHEARFYQQFQPQRGLIGFFFNRADFGNELRPASRPTRCPVVRGYRSSAANDLFGDGTTCIVIFWNRTSQFDYPQCKSLCAGLQFSWVHGSKLQTQSAIGNRQSAITR